MTICSSFAVGTPMETMAPSLTLLIPCFQAEAYIRASVAAIAQYLAVHKGDRAIFIDDGSTDQTAAILEEACAAAFVDNSCSLLRHATNQGKGAALVLAFAEVDTDLCCFLDADVAYDLANCDAFRAAITRGELVIANRLAEQSRCTVHADLFKFVFFRHLSSRIFNALVRKLLVPGIQDAQAGLKMAFTADIRPIMQQISMHRFSFDAEFLYLAYRRGLRIQQAAVRYAYVSNRSTIHFFRDALCMSGNLLKIKAKT